MCLLFHLPDVATAGAGIKQEAWNTWVSHAVDKGLAARALRDLLFPRRLALGFEPGIQTQALWHGL